MNVKEFVEQIEKVNEKFQKDPRSNKTLAESILENKSVWSNDSCMGYTLCAMQNTGFTKEQIETVLQEMRECFKFVSVEEAERKYINY